jgi:hypothetical protein
MLLLLCNTLKVALLIRIMTCSELGNSPSETLENPKSKAEKAQHSSYSYYKAYPRKWLS